MTSVTGSDPYPSMTARCHHPVRVTDQVYESSQSASFPVGPLFSFSVNILQAGGLKIESGPPVLVPASPSSALYYPAQIGVFVKS